MEDKRIKFLKGVKSDVKKDFKAYQERPFSDISVGLQLGFHNIAIIALADMLITMVEREGKTG